MKIIMNIKLNYVHKFVSPSLCKFEKNYYFVLNILGECHEKI